MFFSVEGTLYPPQPLPKGGEPKGKPTPSPSPREGSLKALHKAYKTYKSYTTYKSYKTYKSYMTYKP